MRRCVTRAAAALFPRSKRGPLPKPYAIGVFARATHADAQLAYVLLNRLGANDGSNELM
jgi:hypothetical protein